jgi:acyl-[acyl-carrier-protein]-phospholipid O-acyltransferase/long-chain-fatty-acid--[acyl-carrier-protein] ligase
MTGMRITAEMGHGLATAIASCALIALIPWRAGSLAILAGAVLAPMIGLGSAVALSRLRQQGIGAADLLGAVCLVCAIPFLGAAVSEWMAPALTAIAILAFALGLTALAFAIPDSSTEVRFSLPALSAMTGAAMAWAMHAVDPISLPGVALCLGGTLACLVLGAVLSWHWPKISYHLVVTPLLKLVFRVRVTGLAHLPAPGIGTICIPNHISLLDGLLMISFLPGRSNFALNETAARRWYFQPVFRVYDCIRVDPDNPHAVKAMIDIVRAGQRLVIFAEGRVSRTGAIMQPFDGAGMIADASGAPLVPIHIGGADRSVFTKLGGKVRTRLFPRITITILPSAPLALPRSLHGKDRRRLATLHIYDRLVAASLHASTMPNNLTELLLHACRIHGTHHAAIEDGHRQALHLGALKNEARQFAAYAAATWAEQGPIALWCSDSAAMTSCLLGLVEAGCMPVLCDPSLSADQLGQAIRDMGIATIICASPTSADRLRSALNGSCEVLVYGRNCPSQRRRRSLPAARMPGALSVCRPKGAHGVETTRHRIDQLIENARQCVAVTDLGRTDTVFSMLPLSDYSGLVLGLLAPLIRGSKVVFGKSDLVVRPAPLIYYTRSTVLIATPADLQSMLATARAFDLFMVRAVYCPSDGPDPSMRREFAEKFGVRPFPFYDCEGAGPLLALNTALHFDPHGCGRLLPGRGTRVASLGETGLAPDDAGFLRWR